MISKDGVATDPKKIQAVAEWPVPKTLKQLRGFLGLSGYYRRFIHNYAKISAPLTALLKANTSFVWTNNSILAFKLLKDAFISAPVLALPDFTITFVIEMDASGNGIRAVLTQRNHPLAYISKTLSTQHQALSVYDRELFTILFAVKKGHPYLVGRHFIIKTDHQALKHLFEQKLSTPI